MQIILNIPQHIYNMFMAWVEKYPQIRILKKRESVEGVHHPYLASQAVLSQDWDSAEDDHWDNY